MTIPFGIGGIIAIFVILFAVMFCVMGQLALLPAILIAALGVARLT